MNITYHGVRYGGMLSGVGNSIAATGIAMRQAIAAGQMQEEHLLTEHTFGPGIYARTVHIPAGVAIIGKVHATDHIFILSQGEMTLVTEHGRRRVRAPFQTICAPGIKAGFAHEDCVCTNVHINPGNETDLDKLEDKYIVRDALPSPESLEALK